MVGAATWVAAVVLLMAALMTTGVLLQLLQSINFSWTYENYAMLYFLFAAILFIGFMLLRSYRNPRQKQDEAELPLGQNYPEKSKT